MDKLIYTAFNTVNNIYDNRAVRAQNLANISVPGYKRDLGAKSVGTAFLENMQTLQSRAMAIQDDNNYFSGQPGTLSQTDVDTDIAISGDGYFIVQGWVSHLCLGVVICVFPMTVLWKMAQARRS